MTKPTPYDHTTPPPSPQTNSQSRTPQLSCAVTRPQATVKSHQTTPAAAYTPPCEGRTVARDGFNYPLRRSSSFPRLKSSYFIRQDSPYKGILQKNTDVPLTPLAGRPQPSRDETAGSKPQLSLLQQFLMDTVPQVSHLTSVHVPDEMSPDGKKKKKLPAIWTSKLRQPRRPSEVFNINFSFSASSRRRPSDHTPQISPRTSISSDSGSPTFTSEDCFKRQRVDSSGSSSTTLKPFSSNSPTCDRYQGPGLLTSPSGPSGSWFPEHIKSFRPVATSADPHPGFLVDFSGASSPAEEAHRKNDEQGYHDYLDEERRQLNSSPDENRIFYMDMDVEDDIPPAYREDVTKQARILGLASNAANIKRASTVHIDTRKGGAQSSSSSSGGSYRTRSSSTMSDPSTDKFLTHVRASQAARVLARTLSEGKKGVYANDDTNIWLGDDPL
jgi:hypothetical protein